MRLPGIFEIHPADGSDYDAAMSRTLCTLMSLYRGITFVSPPYTSHLTVFASSSTLLPENLTTRFQSTTRELITGCR